MSIRTNVLAVAAASCMMVGLGSTAAFAGTPTPEPSVTETFTPPPRPAPTCAPTRPITFAPTVSPTDEVSPTDGLSSQPDLRTVSPTGKPTDHQRPVVNPLRCSPEQFVAQITALGSTVVQNRVIASGPVFGTGSDDLSLQTNTRDVFDLPGFFRSVNVDHTGLAFPSIDLRLCVASVNQLGLWRFNRGTGLFRNAVGNGTFLLTGQWVFPTIRGVCSLRFLRGNPILQNRITPRYTNIQVWATGLARR
jgi:hypothetical protein